MSSKVNVNAEMGNAPGMNGKDSLFRFLGIIRKRLLWVVMFVVLVTATAFVWNFHATPIYRASAKILIEPHDPNVINIEKVAEPSRRRRRSQYYRTQYELLKSDALLMRVARELRLASKRWPENRKKNTSFVGATTSFVRAGLGSGIRLVRVLVEAGEVDGGRLSRRTPRSALEERAAGALRGGLIIQPVKRTQLVQVQFEDPDPGFAARVANTVSRLYIDMSVEMRLDANDAASGWLKKEILEARKSLDASWQALQKYKEKHNLVSLEDRRNIVVQKLNELSSAVTKAKTEKIGLGVLVAKVKSVNGSIERLESLPDVIENPVLQELKGQLVILQNEHSELSRRYLEDHPKILRVNSRIESMKKKIQEEIRQISNGILTRYQVARTRERSLLRSLKEQKEEALRLDRMAIPHQSLKREMETNQKLYDSLLKRTRETGVLQGLRSTNIRIVDRAKVPGGPVRPRKMKNILTALFLSLFLGVGFVFALDYFDRTIRSPEEVQAIAGVPTMGVVPELGKRVGQKDPLLNKEGKQQKIGIEHLCDIRTAILFQLKSTEKVIQVTSCLPKEGKTFIAANLAKTISQTHKKVLLIDGDLKRSRVAEMFPTMPSTGLAQVLLEDAELGSSIWRVPQTNLAVLPAGKTRGKFQNLLINSDLGKLIEQLKSHFDIIIVDTPPIFAVNDAIVWSKFVDGLFFVVDLNQITGDLLRQGMEKLKGANAPVIGTIPNRLNNSGSYYYYGYDKKTSGYY
jgi:capsular exopolysaccharide synthesis family protein